MTIISFKRSGGIAGQAAALEVDLESLPAQQGRLLLQLIQDADFFNLPISAPKPANPDEIEYTFTVEAGQTQHTVHTSDTAAPESLRKLVQALSAIEKANMHSS
jgi:hypothetical protein